MYNNAFEFFFTKIYLAHFFFESRNFINSKNQGIQGDHHGSSQQNRQTTLR
jgi:hypothetical protein